MAIIDYDEAEYEPEEDIRAPLSLAEIAEAVNVMDLLAHDELGSLQSRCESGFQADEASRKDWLDAHDKAMDLALQVSEKKSYPFENAANVIYPLITTAAIQFAARAYPNIVTSGNAVKARVLGDDSGQYMVPESPQGQLDPQQAQEVEKPGTKAARAQRVATFMSWQVSEQMPDWSSDTDAMLHYLPIAGCAFRKTWFERGVPKSKWVSARDFVVNMSAKSLESATRKAEIYELEPHEIVEKKNRGEWDADAVDRIYDPDANEAEEFVEMHTRYDLDGDGYPEPYIVHFQKDGGELVRVVANFGRIEADQGGIIAIEPKEYYTKYEFIPNPDGGFYSIGFGWLLGPINRAVNTAINMLFDAGHWQTAPSYFAGKRLRLKAGDTFLKPNEIKPVESFGETIKNELVRVEAGEPSPVLFQLLGLMIEAGRDISSVKDIMMGQSDQNVAPTTALTLVEQGQKSFTAIYKRIHRALKKEMNLLFRRDAEHAGQLGELYRSVLDEEEATPEDFALNLDILPVTDPEMAADGAKLAKIQFIQSLMQMGTLDPRAVTKRALEAGQIEEPDELMAGEPQPDFETQVKLAKLEQDKAKIAIQAQKTEAEIVELLSQALENIAKAEAEEQGPQIEMYKAEIAGLKGLLGELRGLQGMAGESGDAGRVQSPQGDGGGAAAQS